MLRLVVALSLLFSGTLLARPLILEESARIANPDPAFPYFGRDVAVDGDWVLISGDQLVTDPASPDTFLYDRVIHVFQRSGANWSYRGRLAGPELLEANRVPALALRDGVAAVLGNQLRVFERSGSTWTEHAVAPGPRPNGPSLRIRDRRIIGSDLSNCEWDAAIYESNGTQWAISQHLEGVPAASCTRYGGGAVDISSTLAAVSNLAGPTLKRPAVNVYRRSGSTWSLVTTIDGLQYSPAREDFAESLAVHGQKIIVNNAPHLGTFAFAEGTPRWFPSRRLATVDGYMNVGASGKLVSTSNYVLEHGFGFDQRTDVINVFTEPSGSPYLHVATLVPRDRQFRLGSSFDLSGRRVVASGEFQTTASGHTDVRIYDLPVDPTPPAVRYLDFQSGDGGWSVLAGSQFALVPQGPSQVWRQSSTAGDAGATLDGSDGEDQAIEADLTPRAFAGNDRWFGLVIRYVDAANFHYLTLRSSNRLELRRLVDGQIQPLAATTLPVTLDRTYRVRLETQGDRINAYVDGARVLDAGSLTPGEHGLVGVRMYRARVDIDNVVVSPGQRQTIYQTDRNDPFRLWSGWQGGFRAGFELIEQTSTDGDARAVIGMATGDQVVQVRAQVTAVGFPAPGRDSWIGLTARLKDLQNHYYLTVRTSGTIDLRKVVGGNVTLLASAPYTLDQRPHDIRLEVLGGVLRGFVDGRHLVEAHDADPALASGWQGLATWRAAGTFADFLAYQP